MSRRSCNILLACGAMVLGCFLYVCFRSTTYVALLFQRISAIRQLQAFSCDFCAYYFPDFLWAFSLCCLLNAIHLPRKPGTWVCGVAAFSLGALWEGLQYRQAVSGTGDYWDILAYLLAALLSTIINLGGREHEKT